MIEMTFVKMLTSNPFVFDHRPHIEAKTLVDHGYDVEVVAWDRDQKYPRQEVIDGIGVTRVGGRSTYGQGIRQLVGFLRFWWEAIHALQRSDVDILHCRNLDTLLPAVWLAQAKGARLIYDAFESYPDMFAIHGDRWMPWLLQALERVLLKRVDVIITVGSLLQAELQAASGKPTYVVGNWKRLSEYRVAPEVTSRLAGQIHARGHPIIAYIAGLNRDRVILPLIDAVCEEDKAFLIIAGGGDQEQAVQSRMAGMRNGVHPGKIPMEDVPAYLSVSDVVYYGLDDRFPNNRFSAPNSLFAGLAAGRAILTTNLGEIARIVREEECGIVLNAPSVGAIRAAIRRLQDPALLRKYQENARRAAQTKYNWDNAQRILLSIYDNPTAD